MRLFAKQSTTTIALAAATLSLAPVVACGGAAAQEASSAEQPQTAAQQALGQQASPQHAPAQQPATGQQASGQQVATKVPIAIVATTPESPAAVVIEVPEGILTGVQKELGPYIGHPNLAGKPQFSS